MTPSTPLTERQIDEFELFLMAWCESQGVQVVVCNTLADLMADEFEAEAAERAWNRSRWDGRL